MEMWVDEEVDGYRRTTAAVREGCGVVGGVHRATEGAGRGWRAKDRPKASGQPTSCVDAPSILWRLLGSLRVAGKHPCAHAL